MAISKLLASFCVVIGSLTLLVKVSYGLIENQAVSDSNQAHLSDAELTLDSNFNEKKQQMIRRLSGDSMKIWPSYWAVGSSDSNTKSGSNLNSKSSSKSGSGSGSKSASKSDSSSKSSSNSKSGSSSDSKSGSSSSSSSGSDSSEVLENMFELRINCGTSNSYIDTNGNKWISDELYSFLIVSNGAISFDVNRDISGTNDNEIFKTERYFSNDLSYDFKHVTNGYYTIRLHFAELYVNAVGERVFDILIQGETVYSNFDIFEQVGRDTALTLEFEGIKVTAGSLEIEFVKDVDNPKINGIELLQTAYLA